MITKIIIVVLMVIGVSGIPMNVNASGLAITEIDTHPELICTRYADVPGMKPVCDWINPCDDTGEVDSTHTFCTGESVPNPPDAPCPKGFHSESEDESGLCHTNKNGCRSESYILNRSGDSCEYILDGCQDDPTLPRCTVTINLGTPDNEAPWDECEHSVPDHCIEPWKHQIDYGNGTIIPANDLSCRDVNVTDFRVTMDDEHDFDRDYDLIGCETAN